MAALGAPARAIDKSSLLLPDWATIAAVEPEAEGISTYWLEFDDPVLAAEYRFRPGQFNMLHLPGYGEAAISMSSDAENSERIGHTIRFVGNVTRALSRMKRGERIGVRGPFGNAWPIEDYKGAEVVLVAGGIGMAPLRPVIYHIINHREDYGRVFLLYGARTPHDLLYTDECDHWKERGIEPLITVDRADENWHGLVGVVPVLFYRLRLQTENCVVFSCGPDIMMRFVVYESLARRVSREHIYLSLERNMKCGQGFCGHCQLGPEFLCTDGPIFSYRQLEPYFSVEDF